MMDSPYKPSIKHCSVLLRTIAGNISPNLDLVFQVVNKFEATGNSLSKSVYDARRLEDAAKVLNEMQANGCNPDIKTWTILIKGHYSANEVDKALIIFSNIIEKGCKVDADLLDVLVNGLLSQNKAIKAHQVLEMTETR
ncbi:unnamed protein product [Lactuca saligna]|uniref:Pentatricopeptide repeat-containing protein n=1 Tax=Lactuca saligna TaxID=75948 RepID=A0AA35ZER6_LACSI|nr:unnamed protein product [Lactuca saligna]